MIACCDQTDCPLHPDNEWRKQNKNEIIESIQKYTGKNLDAKILRELDYLFQLLYENETIPQECFICSRNIKIDMKVEITASIAKKELMGD